MIEPTPKISIIIPVYNAEKFLTRCIDSVLAQTYTDWELILVNDGSKDSSGKICNNYSQKDRRIQAIHKENGGAASARNVGLDQATGKYIAFIDADDYVSPNLLSDYINAGDFDLIIGGYSVLWDNNTTTTYVSPNIMLHRNDIVAYLSDKNKIFVGSSWNKLYKREIMESFSIRFPETINDVCEDHIFNWAFISKCDCARAINSNNYNYIENPDSLTHKKGVFNELPIIKRLDIMSKLYDQMLSIPDKEARRMAVSSYHCFFSDIVLRPIYLYNLNKQTKNKLLVQYKRQLDRASYSKIKASTGFFNKIISLPLYLPDTAANFFLTMIFKLKRAFYRG